MMSNVQGVQIPSEAQSGGITRLGVHREAHRTSETEHGNVGRENDGYRFAYPRARCMLQQSLEQPAAQPFTLPCVCEHERYIRTGRRRVDDIAPNADELLGTATHRGHGEG